jgi:hypothetical protein
MHIVSIGKEEARELLHLPLPEIAFEARCSEAPHPAFVDDERHPLLDPVVL